MKKLKYFLYALGVIILLSTLLMLSWPISYWFSTVGATEILINYRDDLLLYGDYYLVDNDLIFDDDYDFDALQENIEYIPFELWGSGDLYSEEVHLKLPNQSNLVILDATADKDSYVYYMESCFEDSGNYCALMRLGPKYKPLNSKTHRGDRLVILDKNGVEKFALETTADEWVLDCVDNNAMIYNVSENSFYYKNVETGVVGEKVTNEFRKFKEVTFNEENNAWTAYYKIDDGIVSYIVEL